MQQLTIGQKIALDNVATEYNPNNSFEEIISFANIKDYEDIGFSELFCHQ